MLANFKYIIAICLLATTHAYADSAPSAVISQQTPEIISTPDTNTQKPAHTLEISSSSESKSPYLDDKLMVIGTGGVSGIYYQAGGAICRLLNRDRKATGLKCATESTSGSIQNLKELKNGELDFALVQSDWQEHAFNGTSDFAKIGRLDALRFVMSLHDESLSLIVQKKSEIRKLDDIINKNVNIGPEGSGARSTIKEIFKAKGWAKRDFKSLTELQGSDQSQALCAGGIDVMIVASGHPNADIEDVMSKCDIRILEVFDSDIQKIILSNPAFSASIIPGTVYAGMPNDLKTIGIKATLVTTSNEDENTVYALTKLVFENLENFKGFHTAFSNLDAKKMATEGKSAPYHAGAQKYYLENQLISK